MFQPLLVTRKCMALTIDKYQLSSKKLVLFRKRGILTSNLSVERLVGIGNILSNRNLVLLSVIMIYQEGVFFLFFYFIHV
jgi:hypothetical protein